MQPRAALRQLLRAVDRHVTSVAGNKQWRSHVVAQFRANAGTQDPTRQKQLLLLAKEYGDLVSNIAHHQELLATYNLGVDPDERNKEMVAKTAARVGFSLPQPGETHPPPSNKQQLQQQQDLELQQQQDLELQEQGSQQQQLQAQQQLQQQQQGRAQHVVAAAGMAAAGVQEGRLQQQQQDIEWHHTESNSAGGR